MDIVKVFGNNLRQHRTITALRALPPVALVGGIVPPTWLRLRKLPVCGDFLQILG